MSFFSTELNGLPPTGHYAPDFEIFVEDQEFAPRDHGDVLRLKVVMDLQNMTSCEIDLNNWDDQAFWFKYSDKSGLYVGNRVHIRMGYAGRLMSMIRGQINSLTPQFPQSQASTLSIGVMDDMQRLKDRRPAEGEQRQFQGMSDAQIATAIATRNGLLTDIDPDNVVHDEVIQGDLDDAAFLMQRARNRDMDCYIFTDPENGKPTLRFGAPRDERAGARATNHAFAWGQTLKSFSPTLTMSNQVKQVTVRGWNEDDMEEIVATATQDDIADASGNTGAGNATTAAGGREDIVIGATVTTQAAAEELARSLLRERSYEFITGSGEIIGLPDLRPGDTMTLDGLGDRFSGTYYVKKTEHEIGSKGYSTRFDVRKSYDEGEAA